MEDLTFGEYEDFKTLREVVSVDSFEELLVNESLSLVSFVIYTLQHSWLWGLALFGIIYFALKNRIENQRNVVWVSFGVPLALLVFEIFTKILSEDMI